MSLFWFVLLLHTPQYTYINKKKSFMVAGLGVEPSVSDLWGQRDTRFSTLLCRGQGGKAPINQIKKRRKFWSSHSELNRDYTDISRAFWPLNYRTRLGASAPIYLNWKENKMNTGGKCKSRTYSGFYTCLRLATGPITVLATFLKKPHKNAIFHPINIGYL